MAYWLSKKLISKQWGPLWCTGEANEKWAYELSNGAGHIPCPAAHFEQPK